MKAYLNDKPCIIWPSRDASRSDVRRLYPRNDLFTNDYVQGRWMESCLARGLESLSAMLSTDKLPNKFEALGYIRRDAKPMSSLLNYMQTYSEKEVTANMKQSFEIGFYDNIEQPNEAWFWTIKFRGHPRISTIEEPFQGEVYTGRDTNDLERWGYLIWDHAHLERLGILTKSPSDISATIGKDWFIKRNPKSLETRTREQEKIWSQEELQSTLRPVFDWNQIWFQ